MLKQLETKPGFQLLDHFGFLDYFSPPKKAERDAICSFGSCRFPCRFPKKTTEMMIFLGSFWTASQHNPC